jgi:hypothetical protein
MARHADDIALLEPVRRLRTALAMAEYSGTHHVSKMLKLAHPLIEVRSVPGIAPWPGYTGHDDLRRYFADAAKHESRAAAIIKRAEVTETGHVLAAGELIPKTNRASGAISAWFVYPFLDGLISAVETYLDTEAAWEQAQRRIDGSD